jgi:hypothetical protein
MGITFRHRLQAYLANRAAAQFCAAIETRINSSHYYASVKLQVPLKYPEVAR